MHHLIVVHRAYQDADEKNNSDFLGRPENVKLWQTCRREIIFLNNEQLANLKLSSTDRVFFDWEAEEFLVQVLCGLKSPLVGETEVFGQFKQWWSELARDEFKIRLEPKIQNIYGIVKKVREESLYGLGSQSYGSFLRKKLSQIKIEKKCIDFIGAGQLLSEIIPWVKKEFRYKLWVRDPEKVKNQPAFSDAEEVNSVLENKNFKSNLLVVAAPITHEELEKYLVKSSGNIHLFDLRRDSMTFKTRVPVLTHLHLDHFVSEVENSKDMIKQQIENANKLISRWKFDELNKVQVRPFGWDDL